nr:spore germination protein [Piscibacillus salipiscarius]
MYSFELGDPPNRQPEETSAEVTVRGPRDGFVESIDINVALIRRRLKTSSLSFETFKVGKRSLTQVGLLYFKDIAHSETINHIQSLIEKLILMHW